MAVHSPPFRRVHLAMPDSIRLAKRVAELRACSRSEAERLIVGGWVKVDGVLVEEPQFRIDAQRIEIDPQADPAQTAPVTLLMHQMPGTDPAKAQAPNAEARWQDDTSGVQPLKMHFRQLTACVPLDTAAGGLVVWTQDWRIVRKLTEDAATVEHEFVVEVAGDLAGSQSSEGLKQLNRGQNSLKISWQNETRLRVVMKNARIALISQRLDAAGLQILNIKRIRLGGVSMGKLPLGQWRYLRGNERF